MNNITPKVDIVFKKLFGVEENKDLLISLINSIVSEEDQVAEVTLLNPYNAQNFRNEKLSILDIKAKGADGKRFNIEIQITDEGNYDRRALYYWAKLYAEQLEVGKGYSSLAKTIGIHILNFFSIPESKKYHNVFNVTEKETGLSYFTHLELHTIELGKFIDSISNNELSGLMARIKTSLDVWVAFLTRYHLLNKDDLPKQLEETGIKKALTVLEVMNFTKEERSAYEDHLKWLLIEADTLDKREAKGREEGREEEKLEIARAMLMEGDSPEKISKITRLPIDVINKLE